MKNLSLGSLAFVLIITMSRWLSLRTRAVDRPATNPMPLSVVDASPRPSLEIDVPPFPYGESQVLQTAVTRISEDEFRVVLSKDVGWLDTGIPVIANEIIKVRNTQEEIIISAGPRVDRLRAAAGGQDTTLFYSEQPDGSRVGVDPGLQEVLLLMLPEDSAGQIATLVVQVSVRQCDLEFPGHQQLHSQAHWWFDQRFASIPIRAQ